jgi:hypothetical protein
MDKTVQPMTIGIPELAGLLEPLIRKVVREELAQMISRRPDTFYLKPDSPLRDDLVEILNRKQRGEIKLSSHAETWGE